MKKYLTIALVSFVFSNNIIAQNIEDLESVKNLLKEDFSDNQTNFPILTTVDNYFIIDNGDYLLSRNNTESEYAILANIEQNISDFSLKTAIKLGPSSNKRSSAGVLIKAQTNGTGSLVFELNRKGEYRIKELLINKTYKYLSGKTSNEGWVKNRQVKGQDEFNAIEIKCKDNVYDIYVNNKFITTLFTPSLYSGKMGIIIGRDAKARIAYYYLDVAAKTNNNLIEEHMDDFTVVNQSNKLKQLESENTTLQNSNERLERENKSLKNDNTLKITNTKLQKSEKSVDSLNVIILDNSIYLKNTIDDWKEDKSNLTKLKSELREGNKMISELRSTKKELTTKISVLTTEIATQSEKIDNLNTEITSTTNRLESQKELNKDLNNTNKKITEEKLVLNNQLKTTTTILNNKGTQLSSLKTKNTSLSNEIKKVNTKVELLKSQLNTTEKTEYSLNTKINNLKTELSDLEAKLNKQRSYSTKKSKKLKEDISEKEKEITSLNTQLSVTKKELSHLTNKYQSYSTLENSNTELKSSLSDKEASITTLIDKLKNLKTRTEELSSTNEKLNLSETKKSEEILLLNSTVDELYTKVENMKKVLIYKGFDQAGIDSETVTTTKVENKKNTTTTTNKKKKSGNINKKITTNENVTYTVQIASYGVKVTINQFRGLNDVFYIDSENETFLYMSGKFEDSNEAIEHRNKLVKQGYNNAFIVKLNNK
jgi:DNA repair exonuclease SbcCD ATPase subunit